MAKDLTLDEMSEKLTKELSTHINMREKDGTPPVRSLYGVELTATLAITKLCKLIDSIEKKIK